MRHVRFARWLLAGGLSIACAPDSRSTGGGAVSSVQARATLDASAGSDGGPAPAPVMSPEITLGHPGTGPTAGDDDQAGIAFDGTNHFVVWDDGNAGGIQVRGTRITPAGVVLDPGGIVIAGEVEEADDAKVAFDGVNYLVVWEQRVTPMDGGYPEYRIHGRRVSPAGQVLDSTEIEISTGSYGYAPRVAFCGTNYFVAWIGSGSPLGAHVSPAGAVLDVTPIVLPSPSTNYSPPNVSRAVSGCLVAWNDASDLKVSRIGNTGPLLDGGGLPIPTGYRSTPAALAFDGTNNLVAWTDNNSGGSAIGIAAVRIGPGGAVLDGSPIQIPAANADSALAAAFDGTHFLLAWRQWVANPNPVLPGQHDLHAARISPSGAVVDATPFPITSALEEQERPEIAAGSAGALVVWQDFALAHVEEPERDILGSRVEAGVVLDSPALVISAGASAKANVALTSDGQDYFVAWSDDRGGTLTPRGERRAATGAPLDSADISISPGGSKPVIGKTSTSYVAAWGGGARRVGFDGTVLDAADIPVPGAEAIACGQSSCLVAWSQVIDYTVNANIDGAIIRADGTASVAGDSGAVTSFGISTARERQKEPGVASDGTDFVVVWSDCRDDPNNSDCAPAIYAARVTSDGTLIEGDAAAVQVSPAKSNDHNPAITYVPATNEYLVVWERGKSGDPREVFGARLRVETSLRVLDSPNLFIARTQSINASPQVAYSGDGYHSLVVWQGKTPDVPDGGISSSATFDIFGNWITTAGRIANTGGFPIAVTALDESSPAVATTGKGDLLVAYGQGEHRLGSVPSATAIAGRLVATLAFDGTPCTGDGECASEFCRDGVCCDSDCSGSCMACNGATTAGICSPVRNAEDDTCSGASACDPGGACKSKTGNACSAPSGCVTGFCSDGYCCASTCDGDCDTCSAQPGTCTFLAKGTKGSSCSPGYVCSGDAPACATACAADGDCETRFYCSATQRCTPFCVDNSPCVNNTLCNPTSGRCEAQAQCLDSDTILRPDNSTLDCNDHLACVNGACRQKCESSADCAPGYQCSASGSCTLPGEVKRASSPTGCSTSRGAATGYPWAVSLAFLGLARRARRRQGSSHLPFRNGWMVLLLALLGCSQSPPRNEPRASVGPTARAQHAALLGTVSPELLLSSPIIAGTNTASAPGIATDGTNFLVVYGDSSFGSPGRALLLSSAGTVVNPAGSSLPGASAVASGANEYLVVWAEGDTVRGARVDRAGQVVDAAGFPIGTVPNLKANPKVAWCGSTYFVIWEAKTGGLLGVHVTSGGTVVESSPFVFGVTPTDGGYLPAAFNGAIGSSSSQCAVAWNQYDIVLSRVPNVGAPLDDPPIVITDSRSSAQYYGQPSIASDGTDFLIAWHRGFGGVYGARITANGVVLAGALADGGSTAGTFTIDQASNQGSLAVAWTGASYLLTWAQTAPGQSYDARSLYAVHVSSTGEVLDAPSIAMTSSPAVQSSAALASGNAGTHLVWLERSNVFGSRVDASATLLDAPGMLLSTSTAAVQDDVEVASSGDGSFAVWHDTRGGQEDVYGTRIGPTGQPLDPDGIALATTVYPEIAPTVAYDGTGYLVAWLEVTDVSYGYPRVKAVRVGLDGKITSAVPLEVYVGTKGNKNGGLSAGCSESGVCLVAWTVNTPTYSDDNIEGSIVAADGRVTGITISNAVDDQSDPDVVSDGTNFLVVWTQAVGDVTNVFGARIRADGAPLDGKGVALSVSPTLSEIGPSATYDPVAARYLIVWERAGDIHGTRASAPNDALTAEDPFPGLTIGDANGRQSAPDVAYSADGHQSFVTWQHVPIGATSGDVHGGWVQRDGRVVGSGVITGGSTDERAPALSTVAPGRLFVAYEITASGGTQLGGRTVTTGALDGTTCTADAQCASSKCRDGYCCQRECDTSCETCGDPATPGICTCTGLSKCTTSSTLCTKKNGTACTSPSECSSGHCADGYCCDSACSDPCASCAYTPGTCSPKPRGSLGRITGDGGMGCGAGYLCNGMDLTCPVTCDSDDDCGGSAPGYFCSQQLCTAYCFEHDDCPFPERCDFANGVCYSGKLCEQKSTGEYVITDRGTGSAPDGGPAIIESSCGSYVCSKSNNACLETCSTNQDCAPGFHCQPNGDCGIPPEPETRPGVGCGCRIPGERSTRSEPWTAMAALALCVSSAARRRTRRSPSSRP